MEKTNPGTAAEAAVIIIDQNKLRRASVVNFLRAWADSLGASLIGLCLAITPKDLEIGCECRLVVLNLGGLRIDSPDARSLLDTLYAALPRVPVVLFSDLEGPEEVVAAFRAGINSFIPASIEPELVPQTLTFIIGGGSYFPPSALLELRREPGPGAASDDAHLINDLSPADIDLQGARPGQLTSRQLDVLALLRQGKSNKMIARDLGMREATVKVHVRQILRKLGASNRTQAALSILESSPEAASLGGGSGGEIKTVALPGFEPGEMKAEKAGLFTKGTAIGRQLLVGGLAGAISLIEGDVLEMMATAPSYIALLT